MSYRGHFMNKQDKRRAAGSSRGFTIIEVVLVLAIAGLIFLMVFIALPALQRGQRDTQRKSDLGRISTQITNYSSNSRGGVPLNSTDVASLVSGYLGGPIPSTCPSGVSGVEAGKDYSDPSVGNYCVNYEALGSFSSNIPLGEIVYTNGAICSSSGGTPTSTGASTNSYALTMHLEGQTAPYCIDNRS